MDIPDHAMRTARIGDFQGTGVAVVRTEYETTLADDGITPVARAGLRFVEGVGRIQATEVRRMFGDHPDMILAGHLGAHVTRYAGPLLDRDEITEQAFGVIAKSVWRDGDHFRVEFIGTGDPYDGGESEP